MKSEIEEFHSKFVPNQDAHTIVIHRKPKSEGSSTAPDKDESAKPGAPKPGGDNGGNGGGIGGSGNENNNGGNNGGSTGGNDGGYQDYNPGNNNGGNNAGTNNGGNDNASNNKPNTDGGSNNGNNTGGDNVEINDDDVALGNLNYDDFYAYIQGYPEGDVRPEKYVNREETAAIFFRLLEPKYRDSIRSTENSFRDVSEINWSNKHISTLAKGGILNGYETGDFRPGAAITRGELAAIAAKFDKLEGSVAHSFTDIKGHWAEKYVASASAKGWIKGYPNGQFKPDMPITRAEFVTFINKVLNRNVKKAEVLPGVRQFTDLTKDAWYYEDMVTATNSYLANRGDDGYQKWTELIKPQIEM